MKDLLCRLPDDLILNILSGLSPSEIVCVSRCARRLYELVNGISSNAWRQYAAERLGFAVSYDDIPLSLLDLVQKPASTFVCDACCFLHISERGKYIFTERLQDHTNRFELSFYSLGWVSVGSTFSSPVKMGMLMSDKYESLVGTILCKIGNQTAKTLLVYRPSRPDHVFFVMPDGSLRRHALSLINDTTVSLVAPNDMFLLNWNAGAAEKPLLFHDQYVFINGHKAALNLETMQLVQTPSHATSHSLHSVCPDGFLLKKHNSQSEPILVWDPRGNGSTIFSPSPFTQQCSFGTVMSDCDLKVSLRKEVVTMCTRYDPLMHSQQRFKQGTVDLLYRVRSPFSSNVSGLEFYNIETQRWVNGAMLNSDSSPRSISPYFRRSSQTPFPGVDLRYRRMTWQTVAVLGRNPDRSLSEDDRTLSHDDKVKCIQSTVSLNTSAIEDFKPASWKLVSDGKGVLLYVYSVHLRKYLCHVFLNP
mmetsp:Transcript_23117/g.38030  ORF Transcript_23117/g.38030 Transcript_23117/m.38030 type:complete len:475 (-) Transcript_23117:1217-2641(-)